MTARRPVTFPQADLATFRQDVENEMAQPGAAPSRSPRPAETWLGRPGKRDPPPRCHAYLHTWERARSEAEEQDNTTRRRGNGAAEEGRKEKKRKSEKKRTKANEAARKRNGRGQRRNGTEQRWKQCQMRKTVGTIHAQPWTKGSCAPAHHEYASALV